MLAEPTNCFASLVALSTKSSGTMLGPTIQKPSPSLIKEPAYATSWGRVLMAKVLKSASKTTAPKVALLRLGSALRLPPDPSVNTSLVRRSCVLTLPWQRCAKAGSSSRSCVQSFGAHPRSQ